jgi:hypothetical protein
MKKYLLTIILTALSVVTAAGQNLKWGKPTAEELNMTVYAPDPEAAAVMLCHLTDVSYSLIGDDFKVFYRIKGRVKVLKPEGRDAGDVTIVYHSALEQRTRREIVAGLKATAYNLEGGKVVKTKMENSMVHEERIDKNQMALKFSVPQVRVGTVIEYEYRIESDFYFDIYDWYAQRSIPVAYTRYDLAIPEWLIFSLDESGVNRLESSKSQGSMTLVFGGVADNLSTEEHTFIGRDLPALKDDDFIWHAEDYSNKVTAELRGIYIPGAVHKNYSSRWEDIDEILLNDDDFGGRLKKSSPLKSEIEAAGIPAIADRQQRAAAVCELLRQKVRWNGDYAFWGKSASKVLKEGSGTNADLNFLLINMLTDAGIESEPIVLRSRDRGLLPFSHVSMKYLNTFVVGIHDTDSTLVFYDGSAIDGFLNVLPARLLVDRARAIRKGGKGYWVNLKQTASAKENTMISATLDENGLLKGQKMTNLQYESAAALRRKWRQAKDSTETIREMEQRDGVKIQGYSTHDLRAFTPAVKETMDFTKQCDHAGDAIYVNPLVFLPIRESPFTDATRLLPVEMPYQQTESVTVMLTLPEGYVVEDVPKPFLIKLDGITCRVIYNVAGGKLNVRYQFVLEKTFFTVEEYADLKAYFDQLADQLKKVITVKKQL